MIVYGRWRAEPGKALVNVVVYRRTVFWLQLRNLWRPFLDISGSNKHEGMIRFTSCRRGMSADNL